MFVHFPSTPTPTPSNNYSIGFEYVTSSSFKELRYVTPEAIRPGLRVILHNYTSFVYCIEMASGGEF